MRQLSTFCFLFLVSGALLAQQSTLPVNPAQPPVAPAEKPGLGVPEHDAVTEIAPRNTTSGAASEAPTSLRPNNGNVAATDPLLEPPPLPKGRPTLIGGTVAKIDRIKYHLVLAPYGGQRMKVYFDERTRIFRNGMETTQLGIKKGDRVYIDTLLDRTRVFAKNIRVQTELHGADARGQLLSYDPRGKRIQMRDELSSQPVTFRLTPQTVILGGDSPSSVRELRPGSLITVQFVPAGPNRGVAREISVIATPGSNFIFAGKVTHLDVSSGVVAVDNRTDGRNYEIHFEPRSEQWQAVTLGSEVTLDALFDGRHYVASTVSVNRKSDDN